MIFGNIDGFGNINGSDGVIVLLSLLTKPIFFLLPLDCLSIGYDRQNILYYCYNFNILWPECSGWHNTLIVLRGSDATPVFFG